MWAVDFTLYAMLQAVIPSVVLLACLFAVEVESRHSKDIVFLKSVHPVEIVRETNETITDDSGSNEIDVSKPENMKNDTNDQSRDSRGLLKKLSFLAGLKAGGLISSSGTLAASNSLRIFGKVMNTALSVSYGHADDLDPLPEVESDPQQGGDSTENKVRLKEDVTTQAPLKSIRKQFLKTHNAQVSRINHKFLRSDFQGRTS